MTAQEIQKFVERPTPRCVPRGVLRAADRGRRLHLRFFLGTVFFLIGLVSILFYRVWALPADYLMDVGIMKTADGVIVGWKRTFISHSAGKGKEKITTRLYRVEARIPTPNGEVTAYCYAYGRGRIPGWGQIPESMNELDTDAFVRLKEPFPVVVEYIPRYPNLARAVGSRLASCDYVEGLEYLVIFLLGTVLCCNGWYRFRRLKRLLAEGRFTSGHIIKVTRRVVSVSYNDQFGAKRTGSLLSDPALMAACSQWGAEHHSVGLLYLPGREDVFITDLLVV